MLCQVPGKFRYPFYLEMMWYVVDRYLACLTGRSFLASPAKDEPEPEVSLYLSPPFILSFSFNSSFSIDCSLLSPFVFAQSNNK